MVSGPSHFTLRLGADTLVTIPRPKSNCTRAWTFTSSAPSFGLYDTSTFRVSPGSSVFHSQRVSMPLSVGGGSQAIGSAFLGGVTRRATLWALARDTLRTCSLYT